jgi:hypothetical protein
MDAGCSSLVKWLRQVLDVPADQDNWHSSVAAKRSLHSLQPGIEWRRLL